MPVYDSIRRALRDHLRHLLYTGDPAFGIPVYLMDVLCYTYKPSLKTRGVKIELRVAQNHSHG